MEIHVLHRQGNGVRAIARATGFTLNRPTTKLHPLRESSGGPFRSARVYEAKKDLPEQSSWTKSQVGGTRNALGDRAQEALSARGVDRDRVACKVCDVKVVRSVQRKSARIVDAL